MRVRNSAGFTLLELMITLAIVAILARIALSSYTNSVTKSRRTAAEACLSNYANYMERFYATNLRYDQDTATTPNLMNNAALVALGLDCATAQNTGTYYSYSFPALPTQFAYTIQAVPLGTQLSNDTQCGTLTLNQLAVHGYSGTGSQSTCWQH